MSRSTSRRVFAVAGAALIAATWVTLVLARPADWDSVSDSTPALLTMGGYLGGAALLLVGVLPRLPMRAIGIIPIALALNIGVGEIVGSVGAPIYLDAVGTVFMAALAGPTAGLATGALSSVVWGMFNPAALPFAAVSGATGWLSGWVFRRGAYRRLGWCLLAGAAIGIGCGALAAPLTAFVYCGTAAVDAGALVSAFREMGDSLLASVTSQSIFSGPLDKALVMGIVFAALRALPRSTLKSLGFRWLTR